MKLEKEKNLRMYDYVFQINPHLFVIKSLESDPVIGI